MADTNKNEYEDLAREIVRAQMELQRQQAREQAQAKASEQAQAKSPTWPAFNLFAANGPAWITLLAAMIVAYCALNIRVATVEYKAEVSIQDRVEIHRRMDKSDDTLSGVKADISEIKATVKEIAERGSRR